MTIQDLRREIQRGNSPSDDLLTLWGHQNHTVLELFVLLSEMQHYQAMLVLKPFGNCVCVGYFLNRVIQLKMSSDASESCYSPTNWKRLKSPTEEFVNA